jgi:1-acyl-sn-glycerol-3-phosphate acyltransferase
MLPDVFAMISRWWKIFGVEKPGYAMVHDVVFKIPVIRNLLIRMGAMRASRANASKVLALGGVVVAYPGGTVEALRSFRNRNRIDFDGHTGFIEVALEHGVPILPVVNIGGHEVYFTLFSSQLLARLTGMERLTGVKTLPVNLGLPWGIWPTGFLPYLPLPSKIVFRVGKPIYLPRDSKLARNRRFVSKVLSEVTSSMQYMLDDLASHRRFPILG